MPDAVTDGFAILPQMASRSLPRRSDDRATWAQPTPLKRRKRRFRWLRRVLSVTIVLALLAIVAWTYLMWVYAPGLRTEASSIPTRVHTQLASRGARYITIDQISPNLQHAIVAIEDRRFYVHPGIDPLGMVRAVWINFTNQHIDQGGSTLEQQLVKRTIVPDDRTVHGKLRTIALAWAVDQDFSKSTVIELYLNAAYFGQGAYGAGAAAVIYFGADAAHLTLTQAAFLAALPQAPSVYGSHPTAPAVQARVQTVLQDMAQQGYIDSAQEQSALRTRLTFALPNP